MVSTGDVPGAGTEREDVTRRYRRGPGGWWWLALILVPLLLAVLGAVVLDDGDVSEPAAPASTGSSDGDSVTSEGAGGADPGATTDDSAQTAGPEAVIQPRPFSISREGEQVTVAAEVPDEATRTALLDALRERLGEGVEIVDEVTIVPDAQLPFPEALADMVQAGAELPDFGVDWDGAGGVTLTGTAATEEARQVVESAFRPVAGVATIDNQIIVDPSVGAAAEGCAELESEAESLLEESPVTFASGGAELTDASRTVVNQLAALIASCPGATVEVGGHSDDTGSVAFNEQISQARAEGVVDALVQEGIAEERLTAQGYGAEDPVAPNDTEAGREANRRVEITITEGTG